MAKTNRPNKKTASGSSARRTSTGASKAAPRRRKSGQSAHGAQGSSFLKALTGIFLLVLIVVASGLVIRHFFPPDVEKGKTRYEVFPIHETSSHVKKDRLIESYKDESAFPADDHPEADESAVVNDSPDTPPVNRDSLPVAALIIDDIGYDRAIAQKLAAIDSGLTFSILPHSPHRREISSYAHKQGIEVMLHLPMEPMEYPKVDPGPGALLMSQDTDTMLERLQENLESVPDAVGVNNHMGSRLTSESTKMYQVFSVLRKKGLFFIDSRTSPKSVCRPSAALLQISYGERDVFLDHSQDRETIRKQIRKLIRQAERNGHAIGIGHPHTETYEMLVEEYPRLSNRVRLVHASQLVKPAG